jgi:hypothetical protein
LLFSANWGKKNKNKVHLCAAATILQPNQGSSLPRLESAAPFPREQKSHKNSHKIQATAKFINKINNLWRSFSGS